MSKFNQHLLSVLFACILSCLHLPYAETQSTTVRPYKFGFTIDEQQHRYEKRDERGIVMGEFGFITADGIYHVTVYATDEQGRFRILAMKNYPYEAKPKTFDIMMTPKVVTTTTTTTTVKPTLPRQNFYNEACSGCFLSNGNNKPKIAEDDNTKTGIRTLAKPLPTAGVVPPKSNQPTNAGGQTKSGPGNAGNQPRPTAGQPGTGTQITKQAHTKGFNIVHSNQQNPHKSTITTFGQTGTQPKYVTTQTNTHQQSFEPAATTQSSAATSTRFQGHISSSSNTNTYTSRIGPTNTQLHSIANSKKTVPIKSQLQSTSNTNKVGPTNTQRNTGFTQPLTTQPTNILRTTTAGKPVFLNAQSSNYPAQTKKIDSNQQDSSNVANSQPKGPSIQPNVMDVIVNQVLPSVMGSKGVVAKPTITKASSGGSPGNSLIPTGGKSGNTSPTYGKANTNNPRIGAAGSGASAAGADGDLYRFKYILDYHGHTETGKRNGNKEGNYYAIGDDDIERTIEYVANENGYQPRIHWRKLNTPAVPSKENTLKEYEFVWFTLN